MFVQYAKVECDSLSNFRYCEFYLISAVQPLPLRDFPVGIVFSADGNSCSVTYCCSFIVSGRDNSTLATQFQLRVVYIHNNKHVPFICNWKTRLNKGVVVYYARVQKFIWCGGEVFVWPSRGVEGFLWPPREGWSYFSDCQPNFQNIPLGILTDRSPRSSL